MNIGTEVPAAISSGPQPMSPRLAAGRNGLSQRIVAVLKKLPDGAIWAIDS